MEVAAHWLGEEDDFYNCPIKFIIVNTYELIEKMNSYENRLSSPPDFERHSAKFLLGVRIFKSYLAKFNAMKKGE